MTFIEQIPFLIAISIAVLSGLFLKKVIGLSQVSSTVIAVIFGIAFLVFFRPALEKLTSWLARRSAKKEKQERESRIYQNFDHAKDYPTGKDIYFECVTCGNII